MKTKLIIILLLVTLKGHSQFIDEDWTQISVYVDPVATVKEGGPQIGLEIQKIMHWGWVSASVSHFEALNPSYTDLVGSGGVNFNLLGYDAVRYYSGLRLGFLWREGNGYPLAGGVIGFDWRLSNRYAKTKIHIGLRGWIDHREDQKDRFYGDSDAYEPGLITNNKLLQENGAIVFSVSF